MFFNNQIQHRAECYCSRGHLGNYFVVLSCNSLWKINPSSRQTSELPNELCNTLVKSDVKGTIFNASYWFSVYKRHVCFPISNEHNDCTRDFSYNTTFISPSDQVKVKFHALQPIIDSKCSAHAEKFFCYTRIPPCGRRGDVSVNLPCRWMCNDVASKCKDVFEKRGIPIADCNILLPDGQGDEDGICRTSTFPVPFRHFRPPPTHGKSTWERRNERTIKGKKKERTNAPTSELMRKQRQNCINLKRDGKLPG